MTEVTAFFGSTANCLIFGGTIGENDHRIIGGSVAINRDTIKSILNAVFDCLLQAALPHVGIGGDKAKHGRHVRVDHAGTLSAAANTDALAVKLE